MSKKSLSWIRSKKAKKQMSGNELAAYFAQQLEHLLAIRNCAAQLMARDQRGRDFFVRGETEFVSFASPEDRRKDLMVAYDRSTRRDTSAAPSSTSPSSEKGDLSELPLFAYAKRPRR